MSAQEGEQLPHQQPKIEPDHVTKHTKESPETTWNPRQRNNLFTNCWVAHFTYDAILHASQATRIITRKKGKEHRRKK